MRYLFAILLSIGLGTLFAEPTKAIVGGRSICTETTEPLPYDAEVEFLESKGASYIDTGTIPSIDTAAEIEAMEVRWKGWSVILGSASADNSSDSWYFRSGGSGPYYSYRIDGKFQDNRFHVDLNSAFVAVCSKDVFAVNGQSVKMGADSYSVEPVFTLYLFDCNLKGYPWMNRNFEGRIYSCKIYEGGILIRDFIPVRIGDGEMAVGYMYDKVTKGLFGNLGKSPFVIGPDKQ